MDKDFGKLLLKYPWILSTSIQENYKAVLVFFSLEKVWCPVKWCLVPQPSFAKIMSSFLFSPDLLFPNQTPNVVFTHMRSIASVSTADGDAILVSCTATLLLCCLWGQPWVKVLSHSGMLLICQTQLCIYWPIKSSLLRKSINKKVRIRCKNELA